VQSLCHAQGINRVDALENLGGAGAFIGLQVADQVNLDVLDIAQVRGLLGELLDTILAKKTMARRDRFQQAIDRMVLETAIRRTSSGERPALRQAVAMASFTRCRLSEIALMRGALTCRTPQGTFLPQARPCSLSRPR
jgi:hypothetical protein